MLAIDNNSILFGNFKIFDNLAVESILLCGLRVDLEISVEILENYFVLSWQLFTNPKIVYNRKSKKFVHLSEKFFNKVPTIAMMGRLRKNINETVLKNIYFSHVLSHMMYTQTWLLSTNPDQFSETITRMDYKEGGRYEMRSRVTLSKIQRGNLTVFFTLIIFIWFPSTNISSFSSQSGNPFVKKFFSGH